MKVNMPLARSEIDKHIVTIRRIAEHREYEAEKKMLEAFTACYLDIQGFLGTEYAKYAQDDRLTLEILQQKGEYARFMDEFINRYDGATEHCYKIIDKLVNDTYKLCYQGMVDGVNKSKTVKDLHEQFKAVRAVTPETVQRAVQNPIPKLRLSPSLERSRKKVIDGIKREVTMGLTQGDRMSTMARRITHTVKTGYTQSMLIARTEAHRVREAGFNDASNRIDDILKNNNAEYRMVKIWKTMNDGAVRHTNLANHRDMHNQVVLQDEKFTLVGGAETDAPGQSGIAAEDCNCRCYVSRDLMNDAEFYAATGRHFTDPKDKKPDEPKAEPTKEPETKNETTSDDSQVELKPENYPSAFTSSTVERKNTTMLMDYVNGLDGADGNVLQLYNNMGKMESVVSEGIPFKISHAKDYSVGTKRFIYSGKYAEVKLTIPKLNADNIVGAVGTTLHEEMHLMDLFLRDNVKLTGAFSSGTMGKGFEKAVLSVGSDIGDEVTQLFKAFDEEYKKITHKYAILKTERFTALKKQYYPNGEIDMWSDLNKYNQFEKEYKKLVNEILTQQDWEARSCLGGGVNMLQDIYDALSGGDFRDKGVVKYGHGSKYFASSVESRKSEILANYGALSVMRPDLIDMLRHDKPDLVTALDELVKEMLKKVG